METLFYLFGGVVVVFGFAYYILPILMEVAYRWLKEDVTPSGHVHKWEYGKLSIPVEDKKWNRVHRPVEVPHRVCKECGQKQYRTMRPRCNGLDDNNWNNYEGELKCTT